VSAGPSQPRENAESKPRPAPDGGFRFERDTLAFANELVWEYQFDPATGAMTVSRRDPPPTYSHRCFVVVRTARQFFYHARFEPSQPGVKAEVYRELIRQVVRRNPRKVSPAGERLAIPGYAGLRELSREHEPLLKAECGGAWESYFVRSHWRMVFPVSPAQQTKIARQLAQRVRDGLAPVVHVFRFPRVRINHGVLLFGLEETESLMRFQAYDPNIPAQPVVLTFDRAAGRFSFPALCYWGGGPVSVTETFRGGLF
jgi:hypothetical protein